jgi:hypothetical protein
VKFKDYVTWLADDRGFIPTPRFRQVIHRNDRNTAREEAIVAEVIQKANPRENITGRHPWGPEESVRLQQLWMNPNSEQAEWRDVPITGESKLFTVEETEHGDLPVPNAIREPGMVQGDFGSRLKELLGDDFEG